MRYGPDPNAIYPNPAIKRVCFIKNVITRPGHRSRGVHLLR